MIFISGQPIAPYFIWQLDILLQNLHSLNAEKDNIHVLFSYRTEEERSMIEAFGEKNRQFARTFGYSDTRERNAYPPSERAHIFSKHFAAYPELEEETLFLHDSDLLFRELPDLGALAEGNVWYTADTRSYTGYEYLSGILTTVELRELTGIVGVTEELIKRNDLNAGGAQWIIKKVTASFWSKVEKDCETMYEYLLLVNSRRKYLNASQKLAAIQSWCADMWCILWNGWWEGRNISISDELDFCWPTDHIEEWQRKKILHYSGNVDENDKRHFRKVEYVDFPPYYDHNLEKIDLSSASFPLSNTIKRYRENFLSFERIELPDTTFVLVLEPDAGFNADNLEVYLAWLQKAFRNRILIVEVGAYRSFVPLATAEKLSYRFFDIGEAGRAGGEFELLRVILADPGLVKTNLAVILKDAYIVSPQAVRAYLPELENNRFIFPNFPVIETDSLFSSLFSKVLDHEMLDFNLSKFPDPRKTTGASFLLCHVSKGEHKSDEQKIGQGNHQYAYCLRPLK